MPLASCHIIAYPAPQRIFFFRITAAIIFPLLLLLASQSSGQRGYQFGLQAGVNFARPEIAPTSDDIPGLSFIPVPGLSAGFYFHYGIKYKYFECVSLKAGMKFGYFSYAVSLHNDYLSFSHRTTLSQASFPFDFEVRTPVSKSLYLKNVLGMCLNVLNTGQETIEQEGPNEDYYLSYHQVFPARYALDFNAGIGLDLKYKKAGMFDVQLVYHKGLSYVMFSDISYTGVENGVPVGNTVQMLSKGSYISLDFGFLFSDFRYICPKYF